MVDTPPGDAIVPERAESVTILVVDDDELVREFVCATLRRNGFHVLAAPDGPTAIELAKRHGQELDVAIVDMMMPELDGEQTIRSIHKVAPSVRALLMSGHSENQISSELIDNGNVAYLQKPYTGSALVEKVRGIID